MSTPYAGTEGYSGTETSEQRARDNASSAQHRQNQALAFIRRQGTDGATVADLKRVGAVNGSALPREFAHHGTASATLSILHKTGQIARLNDTRQQCKIYVLPEFIDGRPFEKFIGNAAKAQIAVLDEMLTALGTLREQSSPVDRLGLDIAQRVLRERIQSLV